MHLDYYIYKTWHRASLIAQLVKNPPAIQETLVRFLGWEDPLRRDRLPTPVFLSFSCGSAGKESACNAGDLGLIPGLGRSPEEGKGYPLQYSGLENSMDYIVHWVAKSPTWLSDFHLPFHVKCLVELFWNFQQSPRSMRTGTIFLSSINSYQFPALRPAQAGRGRFQAGRKTHCSKQPPDIKLGCCSKKPR